MKLWNFLKTYCKELKIKLAIYLFLTLTLTIVSIFTTLISSNSIDQLLNSKKIEPIILLVSYLLGISVVNNIINYFLTVLSINVRTRLMYNLNNNVISYAQKLPISYFYSKDIVKMNQQINLDVNNIVLFFFSSISGVTINVINLVVCSFILISIISELAIILVLLITFLLLGYRYFSPKIIMSQNEVVSKQSLFFSVLLEQLKFVRELKIYKIDEYLRQRLLSTQNELLDSSLNQGITHYKYNVINGTVITIVNAIILIMAARLVVDSKVGIGVFLILTNYLEKIISSIGYFNTLGKDYPKMQSSLWRIKEILNEKQENFGEKIITIVDKISLENVSFSYDGLTPVLNSISLTVDKKILVIKGANGAGKSTLLNTIMGLHLNEYSGKIALNEHDIKELNMSILRKSLLAYVTQDQPVFEGSIFDNICLDDKYSEEEINNICQELGFYLNIKQNAKDLSGGERQKIAIIRAFLSKKEIIILDEPSSYLDKASQLSLLKYIEEINKDNIVIIVSHDSLFDKYDSYLLEK